MIKSIKENWEEYKSKCVPKDAGESQVFETRMAFEAGCMIMFESVVSIVDNLNEDQGCAEFDKIAAEIQLICKERVLLAAKQILDKSKKET